MWIYCVRDNISTFTASWSMEQVIGYNIVTEKDYNICIILLHIVDSLDNLDLFEESRTVSCTMRKIEILQFSRESKSLLCY